MAGRLKYANGSNGYHFGVCAFEMLGSFRVFLFSMEFYPLEVHRHAHIFKQKCIVFVFFFVDI